MKFTTSDGAEYIQDEFGIHQLNAKPFLYDKDYCGIYDDPERERKSDVLQAARLGFVMAAHGEPVESILDYGCGNFAFLKVAQKIIPKCFGFDIADYPVPEGIDMHFKKYPNLLDLWIGDVITFHDALEHVPDPTFVKDLKCGTIVISLPNRMNVPAQADNYQEWFDKEYFHRKPSEHLHHFNPVELKKFMLSCGWEQVAYSKHEDLIRTRGNWNIISAAFKRA